MTLYISGIRLTNIRGFKKGFTLNFDQTGRDVPKPSIVIGQNGTCKSTLLKSIALGLCSQADANALLSEPNGPLISHGEKTGTITISLRTNRPKNRLYKITTSLRKRREQEFVWSQRSQLGPQVRLLVCGFGAGRSSEGSDIVRPYRILDSVYSLFNYEQTLISTELTLRRLGDFDNSNRNFYENTLAGIKQALGLSRNAIFELRPGGGVYIRDPGNASPVPLQAWADGYRVTFNWILDVFAWGMRADRITKHGGVKGIVLVDEIDQHIHPSLQMTLLKELAKFLPDIQFVVTTHSPLVALSAAPDQLIALRKERGRIVKEEDIPSYGAYSAADMLEEKRLFATSAFRSDIEKLRHTYRELASIPKSKREKNQTERMKKMAEEISGLGRPEKKTSPVMKDLEILRKKYDL